MKLQLIFFILFGLVNIFEKVNCFQQQSNLILTPFGYLHKECLYEVPSGTNVQKIKEGLLLTKPDKTTQFIESCQYHEKEEEKLPTPFPPDYDGWLAFTTSNCSDGFDSFLGTFSVPVAPVTTPQVLYLFTGLQNVNWIPLVDPIPTAFDIIQPVLQYPSSLGVGWSVKCWYVTILKGVPNGVYSQELPVTVGDSIVTNMTKTSKDTWLIDAYSSYSGLSTKLTKTDSLLTSQPWAYNTLECYGCTGCDSEPTEPCYFSNLELTCGGNPFVPDWIPSVSPHPKCNERAVVVSPSNVTIYFDYSSDN